MLLSTCFHSFWCSSVLVVKCVSLFGVRAPTLARVDKCKRRDTCRSCRQTNQTTTTTCARLQLSPASPANQNHHRRHQFDSPVHSRPGQHFKTKSTTSVIVLRNGDIRTASRLLYFLAHSIQSNSIESRKRHHCLQQSKSTCLLTCECPLGFDFLSLSLFWPFYCSAIIELQKHEV